MPLPLKNTTLLTSQILVFSIASVTGAFCKKKQVVVLREKEKCESRLN